MIRISENWLPVVGYEGFYEVSDAGRVRSVERVIMRSNGAGQTIRARIKSVNVRPDGRVSVTLCRNRRSIPHLVHRLVATAFLRPPTNDDEQVNHMDGHPANNQRTNLEWVTPEENMKHAFNNGLNKNFGEGHQGSKFKASDIAKIKDMAASGARQRAIASSVGMSQAQVARVLHGEAWRRACQ